VIVVDDLGDRSFGTLISSSSFEPRFLLGIERVLGRQSFKRALFLQYEELASKTSEPLARARGLCEARDVVTEAIALSYRDPARRWRDLRDAVSRADPKLPVLVDITTMPREAVFSVLLFLERHPDVQYVYHCPEKYASWLSRDPGRPRLLMQMSGEAVLGRRTVLLVTTGYDRDRTDQLIRTYEPALALLGLQHGEQFNNQVQNVGAHDDAQRRYAADVAVFTLDAYSEDRGRGIIEKQLAPYWDSYNIVMASLGPKLSAVALFQIQRKHLSAALAYAPSGEFNSEYSRGIGRSYFGDARGAAGLPRRGPALRK
jgi:hypothetical protein